MQGKQPHFIDCCHNMQKLSTFRNKAKEGSRQEKLAQFRQTGIWPGMKVKQEKDNVSWSNKVERKMKRDERKRKKELKKSVEEDQDELDDEDDDLEEDYRLLKKAKKNNSAAADDFDRQIQLDDNDD